MCIGSVALCGACGSSSAASEQGKDAGSLGEQSSAADSAVAVGDPTLKVGDFAVRLVEPMSATAAEGFTSITGKVYEGPVPAEVAWESAMSEDGCELLKPVVPFCDPPCVGEVCVADGQCLPNPSAIGVGDVSVRGLKASTGETEFSLVQVASAYSAPAAVDLPYPAFAEGDEIVVSGDGAGQGAFEAKANGIAPLVLTSEELTLDGAAPLPLTWDPPKVAGISKIRLKLDISHHGGTKGKVECEVDDDGAFELPGAMLKSLTDLGVAGYPTIVVTRLSVGSVAISAGRVDLTVYSDVERSVAIPGLVSCTDDSQCSGGATCQPDLTCK